MFLLFCCSFYFFFQAEDGIRDLVRSRGLGDVYKRQTVCVVAIAVAVLLTLKVDVRPNVVLRF